MSTRAAAIAGYFYEADAGRLQHLVNDLLSAESAVPEAMPEALISTTRRLYLLGFDRCSRVSLPVS